MKSDCRIAVVEDDEEIRDSIRDALETEGYSVEAFRNGKDALEGLMRDTTPCLILLDLMMPVMDGWQFLEARRNMPDTYAAIPVFIVSAVADRQRVKQAGAMGYIKKPVDLEMLLTLVRQYCNRQ